MFLLTFLHQIFFGLCFCLQNIIKIVRLLLASARINGITLICLLKITLELTLELELT